MANSQVTDPEIQHKQVAASGVQLHVAIAGDGPPVIMLHGFPENWRCWRKQAGTLAAAGLSVWMPDMRGYNLSDRPLRRDAYHVRHLAADVAALVKANGYPRAHVVGHDWGGIVAWTFSSLYPSLLDRLVVMNAPHMKIFTDQVWRSSQMLRSLYVPFFRLPWLPERILAAHDFYLIRKIFESTPAQDGAYDQATIQAYIDGLAQPGALKAALDYYRINLQSDSLTLMRACRTEAETLVIWGELDPALGSNLLHGLHSVAPNVHIHRIREASHWVQNEAPTEVNRLLVSFLRPAQPS